MGSNVLRSHLGTIQEVAHMAAELGRGNPHGSRGLRRSGKDGVSVAYAHEVAGSPEMLAEKSRRSGGAVFSC